jgi:tyrosyl-tRNA synthetase
LPKLGYKPRIHLLNPIIQGLSPVKTNGETTKMSSSDPNGKIDVLDTPKEIKKKVSKAYCLEKDIIDNTPLLLTKNLIFPLLERLNKIFVINRDEKYGGNLEFKNYEETKKAFIDGLLHPSDLKNGIVDFFSNLLEPIRKTFETKEMKELIKKAYN